MKAHNDLLDSTLLADFGTTDVRSIPMYRAGAKSKMCFDKVRGSVRLMMSKVLTEQDANCYIQAVLDQKLP
jgi:hypothetical protein